MKEEDEEAHRTGRSRNDFIPLSYIDDINSVRVGSVAVMDKILEEEGRDEAGKKHSNLLLVAIDIHVELGEVRDYSRLDRAAVLLLLIVGC